MIMSNHPSAFQQRHPAQSLQSDRSSNQPLQRTQDKRLAFYEIISKMRVKFTSTTTYRKKLSERFYYQKNDGSNDQEFLKRLQEVKFDKLDDTLFCYQADMEPENVHWNSWKHPIEIEKFISRIDEEIAMMNVYKRRVAETGNQIMVLHSKLKNVKSERWREVQLKDAEISDLEKLLNLLLNHPFLRKSVPVLTFVEHCLPLQFWHLKCTQQVPIYEDKNFLSKLINSEQTIKEFITITSDGVLMSTKNLLQTKIDKMIPFTSYFMYRSNIKKNKNLTVEMISSANSNHEVNFKDDYIAGVNFHLGVKQAIHESKPLPQGSKENSNALVSGLLPAVKSEQGDAEGNNRFNSYSPARINCSTKLYNDGKWYFSDLCDQLRKAKNQILITDWWMTPYFLLKRPNKNKEHHHDRLDMVLKQCGDRGVKIFIILFREPVNLLCNDSYDCQIHLENMTRNLRVRRHPIVPQPWSHHEKCVVIDQKVAFMGGLDICYGRWDNTDHQLTDDPKNPLWDGSDYTNERIRGFAAGTTNKWWESPIDRTKEPRMPWHDIALQLRGDAVIDLTKHFIQYWYFVDAEKVKDPYNHLRNLQKRFDRATNYEEPQWEGHQIEEEEEPNSSFMDKFFMCGTKTRLFFTGVEKRLPQLLIKARDGQKAGNQRLQMCRSASPWSIGAREKEDSIHQAYQVLIRQSKQHIYIQNQFFMGVKNEIVNCLAERIARAHRNGENFKVIVVMPLLPGFEGDVADKASGILRVQVHNQFESINRGQNSLHAQLKQKKLKNFNIDDYIFFFGLRNHGMMKHGPETSIIYVHSKLMIVDDRRCIIGSANINDRSLLGDRDSELAIVIEENNGDFSKPMNVLEGDRNFKGISNGNAQGEIDTAKGIFDLRSRLYNQHFGLTEQESASINSPQIWSKVIGNAKKNTELYRRVFGCYPDDLITVSDQIKERQSEADPRLYDKLMPQVFGHAVEFPLLFMQDEDLEMEMGDTNNLMGPEMYL